MKQALMIIGITFGVILVWSALFLSIEHPALGVYSLLAGILAFTVGAFAFSCSVSKWCIVAGVLGFLGFVGPIFFLPVFLALFLVHRGAYPRRPVAQ